MLCYIKTIDRLFLLRLSYIKTIDRLFLEDIDYTADSRHGSRIHRGLWEIIRNSFVVLSRNIFRSFTHIISGFFIITLLNTIRVAIDTITISIR